MSNANSLLALLVALQIGKRSAILARASAKQHTIFNGAKNGHEVYFGVKLSLTKELMLNVIRDGITLAVSAVDFLITDTPVYDVSVYINSMERVNVLSDTIAPKQTAYKFALAGDKLTATNQLSAYGDNSPVLVASELDSAIAKLTNILTHGDKPSDARQNAPTESIQGQLNAARKAKADAKKQ